MFGTALALGTAAWPGSPSTPSLRWSGREGAEDRSVSLGDQGGASGEARTTELVVGTWYPRVPVVSVPLIDGTAFSLAEDPPRVLIVSFWASWCRPCLRELPQLEALYQARRDRELSVLTINMRESGETAALFAEALKLHLPIGEYTGELERAFEVDKLPTLLVVDRRGQIRTRWDGAVPGLEKKLSELVDELLDDAGVEPRETLAAVRVGAGAFTPSWTRRVPGTIEGARIARAPGGAARLHVIAGRELLSYGPGGEILSRTKAPSGSGLLRAGDLEGDGRDELFSFRPGGTRLIRLGFEGTAPLVWDLPSPLFDVEVLPPANAEGRGKLLLATADGLRTTDGRGAPAQSVVHDETFRDLALLDDEDPPVLAALDFTGRVIRFDRSFARGRVTEPLPGGRAIVNPPGSSGVASLDTAVVAVGRFLPGHPGLAACATPAGQLVVLDPGREGELFLADWPGITALTGGDLDGDGVDELVVADGDRISVLSGAAPHVNTAID